VPLQDGGCSLVFWSSQLLLRPSRRVLMRTQTLAYANGLCGGGGRAAWASICLLLPPRPDLTKCICTTQLRAELDRAVRCVSSPVQSNVTFDRLAATRFVRSLQPLMKPGWLDLEEGKNFCSIQNKTRPPCEISTRLRHAS
jgi:hypothetical protein